MNWIPKNLNHAWGDAIKKELQELMFYHAFRVLSRGESPPDGYTFVPMHMVFSVKHDGRHKARYVMNGARTDPPIYDVFSPVVGMDIVHLLLFIAIHNNLFVRMAAVTVRSD